jgi:beta-glucanase (GH16 family)
MRHLAEKWTIPIGILLLGVLLVELPLTIFFSRHQHSQQHLATVTASPTAPLTNATLLPPGLDSSWHLVFDDEFQGTTLDSSKWITTANRPGSACRSVDVGGIACFDPSAISVSNGAVHIEANKEQIHGYTYLGGIINTDTRHYFTYGYFDIRAKVAKGDGLWNSLWLYNPSGDDNEIDILEYLGKDPTVAHQTIHSTGIPQRQFNTKGIDWSQNYHDYAVKWQPGRLTFYIDGIARGTVMTGVPTEKLFLIADLDVGGNTAWSGPPDRSTSFPSYLSIDYVRVYQQPSPLSLPPITP